MQTALIVSLILICAVLGSWKKTALMPSSAQPTGLSKLSMAALLVLFLIPASTVVTLSWIKEVSPLLMLAIGLGAYTYGYFNELIRITTYKPPY
jgi:hypothetical protein